MMVDISHSNLSTSVFADVDLATVKAELLRAIPALNARGLYQSAKWAAELMMGVEVDAVEPMSPFDTERPEDALMLAKTYFDLKEYQRSAHALKTHNCQSACAVFLRLFSRYMAGEKRKDEETVEKAGASSEQQVVVNRELDGLCSELTARYANDECDAFLKYLYGVVLSALNRTEVAQQVLLESVTEFPCLWSAWRALSVLCKDRETVHALTIPQHWMQDFFFADVYLELCQPGAEDVSILLENMTDVFPRSIHVLVQAARSHYNSREFEPARALFEELRAIDPFCLDYMDIYSNILYVQDNKGALSFLAYQAVKCDKYRPETCCIVGNYYSLKEEHEKAIVYFKRALRLNPDYLSAWTLMGHEYVELRKTSSAIEAYRRAVDINPRDYRAWYGLGQTYEIMQMFAYSLYYFKRAKDLRPYDSRMWCAMAECFERLDRIDDCIKCYLRAEGNNDNEGMALMKLAGLYRQQRELGLAAHYFAKVLNRHDAKQMHSPEIVDALYFLAEYAKNQRQYDEAEGYCNRLLDLGEGHKEKAKSLLIEIRQLTQYYARQQQQPAPTPPT